MKTSNTLNNTGEVITKKDLRRLFFDSLSISASLNYEKQMDMGCAFSLAPILQKLYKNKEDLSEALKRHTEFYNVTPMFNPTLLGVLTAMEERNAKDEDFPTESINATKASLILSRLVDTFFSRISLTMPLPPKFHNTAYVLLWEEDLHWQSRSSGCSSS